MPPPTLGRLFYNACFVVVFKICTIDGWINLFFFLYSFVRPDILEQLVKLVTLEPEENVEDKVKFK